MAGKKNKLNAESGALIVQRLAYYETPTKRPKRSTKNLAQISVQINTQQQWSTWVIVSGL